MDENEQFVRQHWERVATGAAALHLSDYCAPIVASGNEFASWQAAREFTEQRREEIRKVERDMLFIQEYLDQSCDSSWRPIAAQSIKGRLQAALAALGQGLKETR